MGASTRGKSGGGAAWPRWGPLPCCPLHTPTNHSHAVDVASTATHVMECELMLEYAVKSAWMRPTGNKLMACLGSRQNALRSATLGQVAVRLWCFDQTVRYDKVEVDLARNEEEEEEEEEGGAVGWE
jgi:hypothetical protein